MKALSVRQPWADLIAAGRKTIETRTWATRYRGDLLITSEKHAIAVVTLTDCRPMTEDDEAAACCELYDRAYAFVLENPRAVAPIEVRGQLRIYTAPVEMEDLILIDDCIRTALCRAEGGTMTVGEIAAQLKLNGGDTRRAIGRLRDDPCGSLVAHDDDLTRLGARV